MKKIFSAVVGVFMFAGVAHAQQYGKTFNTEEAIEVTELASKLKSKNKVENIAVTGTITEVCQKAGCWVKLENEGQDDVFVKFKEEDGNHEMVVPKDIAGKTITVYGVASKKTTSVKDQKHYAEDAGASKEEIAKITKPKEELRIDAVGAVVN